MSESVPVFLNPSPRVRRVPVDRAWTWLALGWNDLMRAPRTSLAYGLVLVVVSFALTLGLILADLVYLLLPLAAGFALVAPMLAVGLYEISRGLQEGWTASMRDALGAWRRNSSQIALMGLILMLLHLAWVRIATLLFALFFHESGPALDRLADMLLFSPTSLPFLAMGTAIGAVLAAAVFAIGVVSIPMLLDRDVSVLVAVATSLAVVRENFAAMALWAALIAAFTVLGFLSLYLGLAVVLPLLGHASWHAYKDLVE
jgi:uncharacterized membrane protein